MDGFMNKLNTVAQIAATTRIKDKTSFQALSTVIDLMSDNTFELLEVQIALARLYSEFFKPFESSKVDKNIDILKTVAKFAAAKDIRFYLNYIYVNPERTAIASDGTMLIMTKGPVNLEPGFYDPKLLVKSQDEMKYPDFTRILNTKDQAPKFAHLSQVDDIKVNVPNKGKPWEAIKIGSQWYQSKLIKKAQAVAGKDAVIVNYLSHGRVETSDFLIVVMPLHK
jgi:hypothetical protein